MDVGRIKSLFFFLGALPQTPLGGQSWPPRPSRKEDLTVEVIARKGDPIPGQWLREWRRWFGNKGG